MREEKTMLDITAPKAGVEVLVRDDGSVLWVNVDGICRLRICRIGDNQLVITDERVHHNKPKTVRELRAIAEMQKKLVF